MDLSHRLDSFLFSGRRRDLWRYAEILPDPGFDASLGEGLTPMIPAERTARRLGIAALLVKDESINPTGSRGC